MTSKTVARFWRLYRDLPSEIKQVARGAYQQFAADSSHPGLQFHRLAAHPGLWSVRITRDYRAVGLLQESTITWIWIGSHAAFDRQFPR